MKQEERENLNYNSVQECTVGMKAEMYRTVIAVAFILLVFMVLINVHFCMVLYQYWQDSLPKEEGVEVEDSAAVRE